MVPSSINKMNFPQVFGKCLGLKGKESNKTPSVFIEPKSEIILSYARKLLPSYGILDMDQVGYVFLKLPDEYIFDLYNLLQKKELDPIPYFDHRNIGAHITVALSHEKKSLAFPTMLNQSIDFTITGCYFTEPRNWEDAKYIWFLTVESLGLKAVRTELGLTPQISGQEFHITFAMQKRFMSFSDVLAGEETATICLKSEEIIQDKIRSLKKNSPSY